VKENSIKVVDTFALASKDLWPYIKEILSFDSEFWIQGQFRKHRKATKKSFLLKDGYFLAGFIPRVLDGLKGRDIEPDVENRKDAPTPREPFIEGITFHPEQKAAIEAVTKQKRGIIHHPTASGKTVVSAGILSCFPGKRRLVLVHTKTLLHQTASELEGFGFNDICKIGDGAKDLDGEVVVAMIQTFSNIHEDVWMDYFDVVLVDETHHAGSKSYERVLSYSLAPVKVGLTATLPDEEKQKERALTIEGVLGPVINKVSISEAVEKGMIARPIIVLKSVHTDAKIQRTIKYQDVYNAGIVENKTRNRIIVRETILALRNDETVLIMIKSIRHGILLSELLIGQDIEHEVLSAGPPTEINAAIKEMKNPLKELHAKKMTTGSEAKRERIEAEITRRNREIENSEEVKIARRFLEGSKRRESIKKDLEDGIIKVVICSDIWREGANIKSLGNVINACGGKSEIGTLQAVGRGLRISEGKTTVKIIDFLDPYRYLAEHTVERIKIYKREGWL
jgi:superfamily II DNA or RNA helicase